MENEFDIGSNPHHLAEAMLSSRLNVGSGISTTPSEFDTASVAATDIPLLTYGQEVSIISKSSGCSCLDYGTS